MRSFVILWLVAVVSADKLGYNYQPVEHSDVGLSLAPSVGVVGAGYSGSSSNVAPSLAPQGDFSASANDGGSYVAPEGNISASINDGGNYGSSSNVAPQGDFSPFTNDVPSHAPQAELEKEFYTFTANEEDFNEPVANHQYANGVKQGLRVIFIKGPEHNGLEKAALALAKQAGEQKIDIYVLNKQADLDDLSHKLNTLNNNNNKKPEVHFVKYRTPEDAANAVNAIQGQYNSLGGSSQSVNGGIAPVLNFASKPAPVESYNIVASAPAASYNTDATAAAPDSSDVPPATPVDADEPSSTYLPANILRLFRL